MSVEDLISSYGYVAVFAGTFLEGETILVLGGFAAHRGFLELHWVMLCAFAGSLAGDQLYYYIGRTRGAALLQRRPAWQAKSRRVFSLLERHKVWLILGFRFMYGIRTVAPFAIGVSGVKPLTYLALNAAGAAVWAVAIGSLGYVFGHGLELALDKAKRYELWALAAIAGGGALLWLLYFLRDRQRAGGR